MTMCLPHGARDRIKKAFTGPREASGFIVRQPSAAEPQKGVYRPERESAVRDEWRKDIERLERESGDSRTL